MAEAEAEAEAFAVAEAEATAVVMVMVVGALVFGAFMRHTVIINVIVQKLQPTDRPTVCPA